MVQYHSGTLGYGMLPYLVAPAPTQNAFTEKTSKSIIVVGMMSTAHDTSFRHVRILIP